MLPSGAARFELLQAIHQGKSTAIGVQGLDQIALGGVCVADLFIGSRQGASPGCVTGGRAGLLLADGNGLMIECQRIRQLTVLFADAAQSQPDPEAVPWLRITGEQRQGAAETSFSLARQILL